MRVSFDALAGLNGRGIAVCAYVRRLENHRR